MHLAKALEDTDLAAGDFRTLGKTSYRRTRPDRPYPHHKPKPTSKLRKSHSPHPPRSHRTRLLKPLERTMSIYIYTNGSIYSPADPYATALLTETVPYLG